MVRKIPKLTELELELMKIIWSDGKEISVGRIQSTLDEQGHPLALPSIRTMLGILQEKGFVSRRLSGKAYLYKAEIPAANYQSSFLKTLLERAFDGSASGLVSALLSKDVVDEKELNKIKQLIKDFDQEQKS